MSASITLHCNREWAEGTCATSLITDARTHDEARTTARQRGWRTHPDGRDYCPGHSGNPNRRLDTNVVHLHREEQPAPPAPAGSTPAPGATVDIVRTASARLKTLASVTDTEIAANTYWHSQHAPREHWFAHGIDNAIGGPAGHLAGLLSPANARFVAQLLGRTVTAHTWSPAVPAEAFLLANNILRSIQR